MKTQRVCVCVCVCFRVSHPYVRVKLILIQEVSLAHERERELLMIIDSQHTHIQEHQSFTTAQSPSLPHIKAHQTTQHTAEGSLSAL